MIKIIDLFAGIGGIRLGFEQASDKIECVFTSEWDKFAQQTYKANHGEEEIHGDITKIDEREIPDHDILLGGFPCQSFSAAGLKKGFGETRGTLFFEIERILKEKKPQAFLLENVKGLVSHDKGKTLETIMNHLQALGYKTQWKVLRARDFGLPQNRERIYFVGFLDHSIDYHYPTPPLYPTRVGDILEETAVDPKYTISDKAWESHQIRKARHKANGKGFGYQLYSPEDPYTGTISARYYKDGSEILIAQHPLNPRKLTPREAGRLQGFPDEFIIPVSDTQAYKQFGNSVAVKVIRALASTIVTHIKE